MTQLASFELISRDRCRRRPFASLLLTGALALAACTGHVDDTGEQPPTHGGGGSGSGNAAPTGGGSAGVSGGGAGLGGSTGGAGPMGTGGGGPSPVAVRPASVLVPTSRTARLSRAQWENTMRDLLKLPTATGLATAMNLSGDAVLYFDNEGEALYVDDSSRRPLELAAETLAAQATVDAATLAKISPPNLPATLPEKARAFIIGFGQRAYRRPLQDVEITQALTLFNQAPTLYPKVDPFLAGSRLVLQLMLQSPHLLYRTELGSAVVNGKIPLSSYEVASKLSYAIANTMPDDALMTAAAQDALKTPEDVTRHALRLLSSPGGIANLRNFHFQVLKLGGYDGMSKDAAMFPQWKPTIPGLLRDETNMFVEYIFGQNLGFKDLLTKPVAFVNATTAPLYGVTGSFGAQLTRVDVDPTQRAGLLTLPGFLALHSHEREIDSIHRGVFVIQRLLCIQIAPPAGAMITPVPDDPAGKTTNRQRVDQHTGKGTCGASCHATIINPAGFAFENYDAIGRYRTADNGLPVNAADTYPFEGGAKSYNGAVEFSRALSESSQAHTCYAQDWMSYLFGRQVDVEEKDAPMVKYLAGQSRSNGMSIKDTIMALVGTDNFIARLPGGQNP